MTRSTRRWRGPSQARGGVHDVDGRLGPSGCRGSTRTGWRFLPNDRRRYVGTGRRVDARCTMPSPPHTSSRSADSSAGARISGRFDFQRLNQTDRIPADRSSSQLRSPPRASSRVCDHRNRAVLGALCGCPRHRRRDISTSFLKPGRAVPVYVIETERSARRPRQRGEAHSRVVDSSEASPHRADAILRIRSRAVGYPLGGETNRRRVPTSGHALPHPFPPPAWQRRA